MPGSDWQTDPNSMGGAAGWMWTLVVRSQPLAAKVNCTVVSCPGTATAAGLKVHPPVTPGPVQVPVAG